MRRGGTSHNYSCPNLCCNDACWYRIVTPGSSAASIACTRTARSINIGCRPVAAVSEEQEQAARRALSGYGATGALGVGARRNKAFSGNEGCTAYERGCSATEESLPCIERS